MVFGTLYTCYTRNKTQFDLSYIKLEYYFHYIYQLTFEMHVNVNITQSVKQYPHTNSLPYNYYNNL